MGDSPRKLRSRHKDFTIGSIEERLARVTGAETSEGKLVREYVARQSKLGGRTYMEQSAKGHWKGAIVQKGPKSQTARKKSNDSMRAYFSRVFRTFRRWPKVVLAHAF